MRQPLCFLFGALFFTLLIAPPVRMMAAQDPPDRPSEPSIAPSLAGRWAVYYEDTLLGPISGEAHGSDDGASVEVFLDHGGNRYHLRSTSVRWEGGKAIIELAGRSPAAIRTTQLPLEKIPHLRVVEGVTRIDVTTPERTAGIEVSPRGGIDHDRVVLELTVKEPDTLEGEWHYRADPLTERDRTGHGRVGRFTQRDENGRLVGEQRGREVWLRSRPAIAAVIVTDRQLSRDVTAAHAFAFGEKDSARHLVVFGRNLPQRNQEIRELVSLQPDVLPDYQVLSFSTALSQPHVYSDLYDRALESLQSGAGGQGPPLRYNTRPGPPRADEEGMELDALLIRVKVPVGTAPGRYDFRLNGARASWTLQYGDATGAIQIIHEQDEEQTYSTDRVFPPQRVRIRIDTEARLPQDSFPIVLGRNGEVAALRGRAADGGSPATVAAKRTADDPTIYLTDPILLARSDRDAAPGEVYLIVADGDTIRATADEKAGLSLTPTQVEARVSIHPESINASWKNALKRAADCAGIAVQDWGQVAFETARTEWNLVLTNLGYHTSPIMQFVRTRGDRDVLKTKEIQVGDHAAMLLLRDGFIEMMEKELSEWARTTSGPVREQFLSQMRAALDRGQDIPLGYVRIVDPEGDEVALRTLFPALRPMREYGISEFEADRLQQRALDRALLEYRKHMRDAVWKAKGVGDCDIPALLDLTGYGFKPVADYIIPRLMKLEDVGDPPRQRWVPDRVARARVASLYVLGEAIRAQRDEADLDTAVVMSLAALATLPLNAVRAAWAAYTVLAVDAADVAYVVLHELPEFVRRQEDVSFSLGASAVTGADRIREAEAREQQAWELLLSGAGAGLGAAGSSVDAVRAVRGIRDVPVDEIRDAGAALVRRLDEKGLDEVSRFTREEARTLGAYLSEAREIVRRAGVEALTDDQRLALRNRERLLDHLAARGEALSEAEAAARALDRAHPPDPRPALPATTAQLEDTARSLAGRIERASSQLDEIRNNPRLQPTDAMPPDEAARINRQRETAVRRTADHIGDLKAREKILSAMIEESRASGGAAAIKADDLDWLTGRRARLNETDYLEARRTVFGDNRGDWKRVTNLADGSASDQLKLHKALTYRREQVNGLLDEVMRRVEAEEGVSGLRRQSFGSNNLKSDYDLSIEGPGAELVVKRFNEEFRKRFGGQESGTVFDTNVYTDPVYRMFRADAEVIGPGGMSYAQFDDLRQFMYDQMATVKYMTPEQWKRHRALLEEGASEASRGALRRVLNEVEYFQASAHQQFLSRVGRMREARTPNLELRVTNDLSGETLEQIHGLRKVADALSDARRGKPISMSMLPPWMHGSEFALKFDLVSDLIRHGDPQVRRYGEQILDELQARVANQLRIKQGHALYYASEAYQTEGTIRHVVGEIQAGGEAVTAERLLTRPLQHPELPGGGPYLNSLAENRANMYKELNAMHAFDEAGNLASGFEKAEKAAIKVAKYFVRQLDAAHRAGIDLREALSHDLKLIAQTVELDKARSSSEAFQEMLRRMDITPEDFVARALNASDVLSRRGMENSPLHDFADALARFYRNGDEHAASIVRRARENPGRLGPPDPPGLPGGSRAASQPPIDDEAVVAELRRLEEVMESRAPARYADPVLTTPEPPPALRVDDAVRSGDETLDNAIASADETINRLAEGTVDMARAAEMESTADILARMRRNNPTADETIAPPPADLPPPAVGPGRTAPTGPNLPGRDGAYTAGRNSEFYVGEYVGQGKYSVVYAMPPSPDRPKEVIKILAGEAIENGEDPFIVAREMDEAQRLLRDAGIEHLPSEIVTRNVDRPHMFQRDLRGDPNYQLFSGRQGTDPTVFTRDHQEAVVKLFKKLADKGLIWEDAKIDNMYFTMKDGELVAGILDTDRIVPFGKRDMRWAEIRQGIEVAPFYTKFKIRSLTDSRRPPDIGDDPTKAIFPDAEFFMEKMFEYGERWIAFDRDTRTFRRTKIDPDLIARHFPGFRDGRNVDFDFVNGRPLPEAERPPVSWRAPEEARPDPLFDAAGETHDIGLRTWRDRSPHAAASPLRDGRDVVACISCFERRAA
ncbi:MAG: hypothetical protein KJZ68_01290 [Phycisphaerales bacterium]|nr:hypothetical protein [Phycisphaerales bacterium]